MTSIFWASIKYLECGQQTGKRSQGLPHRVRRQWAAHTWTSRHSRLGAGPHLQLQRSALGELLEKMEHRPSLSSSLHFHLLYTLVAFAGSRGNQQWQPKECGPHGLWGDVWGKSVNKSDLSNDSNLDREAPRHITGQVLAALVSQVVADVTKWPKHQVLPLASSISFP